MDKKSTLQLYDLSKATPEQTAQVVVRMLKRLTGKETSPEELASVTARIAAQHQKRQAAAQP
jgi:hypothetical protein